MFFLFAVRIIVLCFYECLFDFCLSAVERLRTSCLGNLNFAAELGRLEEFSGRCVCACVCVRVRACVCLGVCM